MIEKVQGNLDDLYSSRRLVSRVRQCLEAHNSSLLRRVISCAIRQSKPWTGISFLHAVVAYGAPLQPTIHGNAANASSSS